MPELRWPDDALGLGRVLDLAEDAWNDPYTCPRAFHLLAEVAARAAPTGLRAEAERRATHRGGRQVIPFDAFDLADAVVAGEAPRLVRAWAAIPSAAAASLLPPTDRATRLVTALRAAWDTLAWPWPRGGTGEVLTLLDTSAAHATGSAVFKAWVESAPARLAVLLAGAHTAEAPTGDLYARAGASTAGRVFRGSVGQATPSHIAGLPEPERAATVRFAAVLLLEKDALSRARDLGLDVRDSAAIRDWAWHVIVRVAAPGALVSLPDEAWLTLIRAHLLDALPPADDWLKPCLRRLGSDLPLPPTDLPDADPAIAAALLRMWPLVLDVRRAAHPESGAPNPDVARFVRRWPPGLPELLVGPPYVGEGLDGPLPLPSLPDSELKRIAENLSAQREDPANREAYAELFWLLLAHAPAPLGPTVATLNEGAFPPVLPDSGTRRLLREALSLLGPRHPVAALAATFRRGATQGGEQACVALALLPANVLGPIPPATIAALFTWYRAMPAGRVGIASELQVILADWPQARILVVEAGPFSVTRSSWHQEFARRPIALCFDGLDPAELPEAPLSSINRYFSGGGNFGVWAALLSALTGPMPPALEAELRGFTAGACTQPMHSGDYRSNIRVVGDPVAPEQIVAFLERNWRHLKRREGRFPHYAPDAWRDRGWWFVGVGTTGVGAAMVVTGFVEGALVTLAPSGSPDLRLAFRDIVLAGAPWAIVGLAVLVAGLMLLRHRSGEYQVVDVEDRRTGSDERRGQIRMSNAAIRYFDALEVHRRRHARSRARPPTRPDCRDHTD